MRPGSCEDGVVMTLQTIATYRGRNLEDHTKAELIQIILEMNELHSQERKELARERDTFAALKRPKRIKIW